MAFVLVGGVLGALAALVGVAILDVGALAAFALWAASGPLAAMASVVVALARPDPAPPPEMRDDLAPAG